MASHVVVIDTSFRRQTVKTTPGMFMTDILDEACKKFGIKSSNYGLKHSNKPVDLSRTFRQTGLTSGAKLELVVASRSPSVVSVALQLPELFASTVPGCRLTDKFPSDTTLWLILRKFESTEEKNLNFTARGVTEIQSGTSGAGRIYYEMPVLKILGRELATFEDLQKTLAQLGLNKGSGLIRLEFRKTEQPLEEAMTEISQYFKEAPPEPEEDARPKDVETITDAISKLPNSTSSEDVDMVSADAPQDTSANPSPYPEQAGEIPLNPATITPSKRPAPETSPEPPKEEILGPDKRPISVFSAPSSDTPKAALQPYNEADFEPTIIHAKLHQERLQNNSHNKRMPSDAEIERIEQDKAAKLAAMKRVRIKIKFPDESSVISPFTAEETGADLYKYVTGVLIAEDQPFKLVYIGKGSQTVPKDGKKKLIKDLGFEGGVTVMFLWEDGASDSCRKGTVLKPQFAQSAKEVTVPEISATEVKEGGGPSEDKGKGKATGVEKAKNWILKGLSKK